MTVSVGISDEMYTVQTWCNTVNTQQRKRDIEYNILLVAIGSMIDNDSAFWVADCPMDRTSRCVAYYNKYVNFQFAEFREVFL